MLSLSSFLAAWSIHALLATLSHARYSPFPPEPEGVTILQSKIHPNVSISYKEPGICETTPGIRSFSGYVHLPPYISTNLDESQDYPLNTFFWFFESRHDAANAPLVIVLNGGPGSSSTAMAMSAMGPCSLNSDGNSTVTNPWSWNQKANLLFIDQPNMVGFSYDTLTNITVHGSGMDSEIKVADFSRGIPPQNKTFHVGVGGTQDMLRTANSTQHAAIAMWHFAQVWFTEYVASSCNADTKLTRSCRFPEYKPSNAKISLMTASYGGRYGPAFVDYFLDRNEAVEAGIIDDTLVHVLHIDTLGILNGRSLRVSRSCMLGAD